jgi:xylan 1,4-beta-xylosidase
MATGGLMIRTVLWLFAFLAGPALAAPTATFDFVSYRALEDAQPASAGTYRNPVLPGFHPDPSIVAVGSDFYLVTSTFSWFPGLPIFHSTDLVNWRLVGHAIDRPGQVDFSQLGTNRGLFAPAITHHRGKFWIVNTCIDCRGNFVITADKPEGPWSDPVWLDFGGIDPSLFFDDDGSAWIVYNDAPPGEPLYEGHRALWIQRFDPAGMRVLPERKLLVNGGLDLTAKPVWAEGPHIYKVGEWYYLTAAEGGTADQHSQTIYRSRKVDGPYEAGPINPILTQRDLDPARPGRVEATGHADLVQLADGSWWGVFLATRPFAGQSTLLGRETYLLPVRWTDGWPRFLDPGEPVPQVVAKPRLPASPGADWTEWRDEFAGALSPEWIGLRTPGPIQRVMPDNGSLHLIPGPESAGGLGKAAFVGRRLRHHRAEFVTRVQFAPERDGEFAGLLALMDESHFVALGIEPDRIVLRRRTAADQPERGAVFAEVARRGDGPVELRIAFDGGRADFAWRPAGEPAWRELARGVDVEPLASVHAGLFTGLVVGPYAVAAP